jgi:hypothetical protein
LRLVVVEHGAVEKRVDIPRNTLNAAQRRGAMIRGARFSMPRAIASPGSIVFGQTETSGIAVAGRCALHLAP